MSTTPVTTQEKPVVKRSLFGTESHDNPFTQDGELSHKADYILRHSLISRSEIRISDPDLSKEESKLVEETINPAEASVAHASPNDVKLNGKSVEAKVESANASQPEPQQAEQVKLKEPKCKCCTIM